MNYTERQLAEYLMKTGQLGSVPNTYKTNPHGNVLGDALITGAELAGTGVGYADRLTTPLATNMQRGLRGAVAANRGLIPYAPKVARFAASPKVLGLLKGAGALGAVGGVMGAADVLVGQDSAANKAMDTGAMAIGGLLGTLGGPVGIAAGMGAGKTVSDATQWIFGDKKTAEQRKMEEAMRILQARGMV